MPYSGEKQPSECRKAANAGDLAMIYEREKERDDHS